MKNKNPEGGLESKGLVQSSPRKMTSRNNGAKGFFIVRQNKTLSKLPLRSNSWMLYLINLLSVTATLGKSSPTSSGLAQHDIARSAQYNRLRVAEYGGNLKAARTLDVHKETIRALYKTLELVCTGLLFGGRVEEIDRHLECLYEAIYNLRLGREQGEVGVSKTSRITVHFMCTNMPRKRTHHVAKYKNRSHRPATVHYRQARVNQFVV